MRRLSLISHRINIWGNIVVVAFADFNREPAQILDVAMVINHNFNLIKFFDGGKIGRTSF